MPKFRYTSTLTLLLVYYNPYTQQKGKKIKGNKEERCKIINKIVNLSWMNSFFLPLRGLNLKEKNV